MNNILSQDRRLPIAVISGLLSFGLSVFGTRIVWDSIVLNLSWSITLPILVSLAYGRKYAFITAISGSALFPFMLWSNNGWSNVGTAIVYTLIFGLYGSANLMDEQTNRDKKYKRYIIVVSTTILVFMMYYRFGFNPLLSLNPPFWQANTITSLTPEILFGFFFKDSVQFISFLLIAVTLLHVPFIRKIYKLEVSPISVHNNKIFLLTIFGAILLWLIFVGLGFFILPEIKTLHVEHISIALLVFFTAGYMVALILMNFSESQMKVLLELNKNRQVFMHSIEYNPIPMILSNTNGQLTILNKQFEQVFGYKSSQYNHINQLFEKAIVIPELRNQFQISWTEYLQNGGANMQPTPGLEVEISCSNGTIKQVEVSSYIEDDLVIISFLDLTHRIETEKKLLQAIQLAEKSQLNLKKKNQEYEHINEILKNINQELIEAKDAAEENNQLKTAFLQNLSHEIRTPMNAIIGFSEFLEDPTLSPERRKNFIKIIHASSNRLLATITDIITISSIEKNQVKIFNEKVNLKNLISDIAIKHENQAHQKGINMFVRPDMRFLDLTIQADKGKLFQIFNHLLANAFKFTKAGYVEFGYNVMNTAVEFYVKDTGIGIAADMHEKIFERFRQADKNIQINYGGTGLGLAICKSYIEMMGGNIRLESVVNDGSVFYFTLPLKTD